MTRQLLTLLTLPLLFSFPALAAQGIELKSTAEVEITVTGVNGEKELKRINASQANVVPGETVIFTTHYVNHGEQPATAVVITNPVPEHMIYLEKSAEGKGTDITFSIDQGKSFAAEAQLKVKDAEGKEREATVADYTHIRWTVEGALARGAIGSVSFRAKVK